VLVGDAELDVDDVEETVELVDVEVIVPLTLLDDVVPLTLPLEEVLEPDTVLIVLLPKGAVEVGKVEDDWETVEEVPGRVLVLVMTTVEVLSTEEVLLLVGCSLEQGWPLYPQLDGGGWQQGPGYP